jgi:hypothetical protein
MLDREELSSSSYADSVDSLENESSEDSQDEERNNYSPSYEEFALYSDFISGVRPLFDQIPDELSIELSRRLAFLFDSWLSSHIPLQCPAQPSGPPTTSNCNTGNSNLNQTRPVVNGQKRASSDGNGSSPPGDNSDGNRKRPRTGLSILSARTSPILHRGMASMCEKSRIQSSTPREVSQLLISCTVFPSRHGI